MKKNNAKQKEYAAQRKQALLRAMTVKDVLKIDAIQKYCNALISGTVKKKIYLEFDEYSDSVYTTGTRIVINPKFSLVKYYDNVYSKLMCIIGLLAHELAHVKYLDFGARKKVYDILDKEWTWVGKEPDDEEMADKLMERCKKSRKFNTFMINMFHNYNNIFDDVHDEACLFRDMEGTILAQALSFPRCAMENGREYLDDEIYCGANPLSLCAGMLLSYARYGNILVHEHMKDDEMVKMYTDLLDECKEFIEQACVTNDMDERFGLVNDIMVAVFRFYEELPNKEENPGDGSSEDADENADGSSQDNTGASSGSGSSSDSDDSGSSSNSSSSSSKGSSESADDGSKSSSKKSSASSSSSSKRGKSIDELSDSELSDILNALDEVMKNLTPQAVPEMDEGDNSDSPDLSKEDVRKSKESTSSESREEMENKLKEKIDTFIRNEVQKKYEAEEEKRRTAELNKEAKDIDYGKLHSRTNVRICRASEVDELMKVKYNNIYKEVQVYSKAMQRQILAILKDRRAGGKLYGQIYGNRFESRSIARLDGCCFSKTKIPTESPTIAIGILIDESGSMRWGGRIEYAKKAAIMLEDFARGLDVPTMIYGHTEDSAGCVVLRSYSEFKKIDKNDRYRLVSADARYNNRDGFALKYMVEALKKRQEEVKLLFIISDGQPAANGYHGRPAIEDIKNVVSDAKKSGVLVFAAAIGDDKPTIAEIYGEGFCNISDMERMPKVFANLIKKQLQL